MKHVFSNFEIIGEYEPINKERSKNKRMRNLHTNIYRRYTLGEWSSPHRKRTLLKQTNIPERRRTTVIFSFCFDVVAVK